MLAQNQILQKKEKGKIMRLLAHDIMQEKK